MPALPGGVKNLKTSPESGLDSKCHCVSYFTIKMYAVACGYTLEVPHGAASNEYPQGLLLWSRKKYLYTCITSFGCLFYSMFQLHHNMYYENKKLPFM